MRLFGGSTEFEGGLEICLDEHWLTLSSMLTAAADLDKPETANKVCHKLGFSGIGLPCMQRNLYHNHKPVL